MNEFFDKDERFRREGTTAVGRVGLVRSVLARYRTEVIAFFMVAVLFVVAVARLSQGAAARRDPAAGMEEWYPQQAFYRKYYRVRRPTYELSFISDDDRKSRRDPARLAFTSTLLRGRLRPVVGADAGAGAGTGVEGYELELREELAQNVTTTYNENGRGMELSELCNYRDKLLAFDDRTGLVFWYSKAANKMVPYVVLVEGSALDGDKGQKTEWAFVAPGFLRGGQRKGRDVLYVGSIGKEWNDAKTGAIVNRNNQWVKILDIRPAPAPEYGAGGATAATGAAGTDGSNAEVQDYAEVVTVEHVNVRENLYEVMREQAGALHPGYIVHEAACYNRKYRNWWFLPRRHSREPYSEAADEHAGTDLAFVVNTTDPFHATAAENAAHMQVRHLGVHNSTHGWSSCKFLPYNEDHLLATRSVEVNDVVATYATVIEITTGRILLPETFLGWKKYEGVEII